MSIIVGVRFKQVGKIYYFDPANCDLHIGDGVIVETARGVEFGKIVTEPRDIPDDQIVQPLKPVLRKATKEDVEKVLRNARKRKETMRLADEKIKKHGLEMKLTDAEYTFDSQKIIFYFTAEGRIDFRELVRDLASIFKARIELRQIGIRDESKAIGGIAPCGRVCCCAQFLGDFEKVSIKMAKTQGLSLNPTKISGLCGRLMCCLAYENEHYAETGKLMPKQGSFVHTEDGNGIVMSNDMLRRIVSVKLEKRDGFEIKQYPLADIKFKDMDFSKDQEAERIRKEEAIARQEEEDKKPKKEFRRKVRRPESNDGTQQEEKTENRSNNQRDKRTNAQNDEKNQSINVQVQNNSQPLPNGEQQPKKKKKKRKKNKPQNGQQENNNGGNISNEQ